MKRDWLLYLVIFSLALNFGTIGSIIYLRYWSQPPALSGAEPPPLPPGALWRELNLDETQRAALRQLFPEHRRKVHELREQLGQKRQEFFDLLKSDSPSWDAIQAKIKEVSVLQGSLEEEMARHLLEVKKQLKPEQQAAFVNLMRAGPWSKGPGGPGRRSGMGPGHGMGPGRGMGPGCPPGGELPK